MKISVLYCLKNLICLACSFIGGNKTRHGVYEMARLALEH